MLILSLLLAHLVADFYLQTDDMVKDKQKYIKKHITHHFFMTTLILGGFLIGNFKAVNILHFFIFPLLFIVVSHFFIDFVKIKMLDTIKISNEENLKRLSFFILDQVLHLLMIFLACHLFIGIRFTKIVDVFEKGSKIGTVNAWLFIAIIVVLTTSVSGHAIRILLGSLPNQLLSFEGRYAFKADRQEDGYANKGKLGLTEEYHYTIFSKHDLSRGKLIGYLERLLVLVLTFYSAYPAIGFIVAAKSIARFKQMDDRNWAEYFLLGTLTSMFIGISLGIVLREVLT
ncbi:DUF3307 domain-containing protein [Neobacillus sp. MM2021_6]|uniref:DUF3307 domain-containing protein n=1 Tax=Bacillaceae TaxID=186817 RepID=UPI00140B0AE4|nr:MULTISPECIES: DUF3307 domain-containing protein [Bacillaceae]MBO0960571.1 DUF3307 domain-containing protein [Neobacillus sp. MM2021_6]NHC19277.1 DUF3307 domain-containing protein [Bacillus sp. MM2020_4]